MTGWTFPRGGHDIIDVSAPLWECGRCGMRHEWGSRVSFYVVPCEVPLRQDRAAFPGSPIAHGRDTQNSLQTVVSRVCAHSGLTRSTEV